MLEVPAAVVPSTDWTFFRAELLELADRELVRALDKEYVDAAQVARRWFGTNEPSEMHAADFLRQETAGRTPGVQITRARGCQAGAFMAGWQLKINVAVLLGQSGGATYMPKWSDALAGRLEPIRSPLLAAVAAALLTPGVALPDLGAMRVVDLVVEGAEVRIRSAGKELSPSAGAEPFLRAYQRWRSEMADDAVAALWLSSTGEAIRQGWFRRFLSKLTMLTGEPFGSLNRRSIPAQWNRRLGIAIARLT